MNDLALRRRFPVVSSLYLDGRFTPLKTHFSLSVALIGSFFPAQVTMNKHTSECVCVCVWSS